MTDINTKICNPDVARKAFELTHSIRIPFSKLNSTIVDMLNVYVSKIVSGEDLQKMLDATMNSNIKISNTDSAYLYIFGPTAYELFLQLIAIENQTMGDIWRYTSNYDVIYSSAPNASYDNCRPYSSEMFWNIQQSQYAASFTPNNIHLISVVTRQTKIGDHSASNTDVCLYLPFGDKLPNIEKIIVENREKHL